MKRSLVAWLTLLSVLGFATAGANAQNAHVVLSDPGLPLQEIRPNDRRVFVLVLDGKWLQPGKPGTKYHVNFFFPDGSTQAHRVLNDALFARGEVRCLIQENQLLQHQLAGGGGFTIAISADRPAAGVASAELLSKPLEITWPMNRPITRDFVRGAHTPPGPVDAFPVPDVKDRPR